MALRADSAAETSAARSLLRGLPDRFRPPALPGDHVERPRLLARLDAALERRLTTVVAGPGYGKTTILAAWSARRDACWYTVDERDSALERFAGRLARALPIDDRWTRQIGGTDPEPAADRIADEIESLPGADVLLLVVDDVHELGRRTASARLLGALCRRAPPRLHLILSSRQALPFSVERLRGRGQVAEIPASLLAFTVEEVERLLPASHLVAGLDPANRLLGLTSGWPAATRLAVDAVRDAPADGWSDVLARLESPAGPLFAYLAGEAFRGQPAEVRELLRTVSVFDRFSIDLCVALGLKRARGTLEALSGRGMFVREDGDAFVLHELVRDFVSTEWPLSPREQRTVLRRATRWFTATGRFSDALDALVAANEVGAAGDFLRRHGTMLIQGGAARNVAAAGSIIPHERRDAVIDEVVGAAQLVLGDREGALDNFERAARGVDRLAPSLAARLCMIHHDKGEFDRAADLLDRTRLDGSEPAAEARLLAGVANARRIACDPAGFRDLAERALARARHSGDSGAVAAAHTARGRVALDEGDLASAVEHFREADEHAERSNDVLERVRALECRGETLVAEGAAESALSVLHEAVTLAELSGSTFQQANALRSKAEVELSLGRLDEALTDLWAAKALLGRIKSGWVCTPVAVLGEVFMERGDLATARAILEQAVEMAAGADFAQALRQGRLPDTAFVTPILVRATGSLARVLVDDRPELAARLSEFAVSRGPNPYRLQAVVADGWVAHARGDLERAAARGQELIFEAARSGDRLQLAHGLELRGLSRGEEAGQAALEESLDIWGALGNAVEVAKLEYALARLATRPDARAAGRAARRKLRLLGVRDGAAGAAGLLMALGPERPPPLEVRTLGGFRVLREGVAVPAAGWQSRKARDLLKLLVARRGRPCRREVLIEALWPDDDPGKTGNRLSVALSALRSVLDPAHVYPADHYLEATREVVSLQPGRIVLDTEAFLAEAEAGLVAAKEGRGEEARELLEAAEASYAGDFLEEDLYEDWATAPREDLRATYIAVCRALAGLTADGREACRYLRRVLQRDPYDEQIHLELVRALSAVRARGEARQAYRAYAARMNQLGVEPAPFPTTP